MRFTEAVLGAPLVMPVLVGFGLTATALVLRQILLGRLAARARRQPVDSAGLLHDLLRFPSLLWSGVLGLYGAVQTATLPPGLAGRVETLLNVLVVVSITLTAANVVGALVARFGERRTLGLGVTGIARTIARGVVLTVGGLIILGNLGIAITPIITALGVGGLAVALALQDTLSNLFAGVHLLADRPIRVGDFVKIDAVEGFVQDIGWRSTRIRTLPNNLVIVPNAKLAQSTITNYHLPEPRMSLLIPVSVGYGSDPDRVEQALADEAIRAVGEVPGLLGDPAPFVRLIPGFGALSLDFTLICQVATFTDQYLVQHELRKRVLRRLRAEGIEIPVPVRTVELRPPDGRGAGGSGDG